MRVLRNNGLTIVLMAIFLITLFGQLWSGQVEYNDDQRDHGLPQISLLAYGGTSHFWQALAENVESEFLQMAVFVVFTVFLFQKGSPETKDPDDKSLEDEDPRLKRDDPKAPWPVRRGGFVLWLYSHSLSIFFLAIFFLSFGLHALAGRWAYARAQQFAGQPEPTLGQYVTSGRFWFESMQNWQNEFLSLAAMVYASVYLRERGSAESKRVAAPHDEHE
ncbi:MAG: hypothetical protein H7144_11050 [Burkholderiales bacterium]|nr:hypothetical protein [Phycisphaerae bacterium]